MSSWYLSGPAELRFNWAKKPTFECPNADPVTYRPSDVDGEDGTWTVDREEIAAAATAIGADPVMLGRLLRQRHASLAAGRLSVDGALTDQCAICGTRMTRKGFRAWIDAPTDDPASQRISGRLGLGPVRTTRRTTWHRSKREAEAWARHERARAIAAEKQR